MLVGVHELVTKTGQGGVRIDIVVSIGDVRPGHGLVGSLALCKSPQEVALRLLRGLESKPAVCAVLHHSVQPTSYLDVPFWLTRRGTRERHSPHCQTPGGRWRAACRRTGETAGGQCPRRLSWAAPSCGKQGLDKRTNRQVRRIRQKKVGFRGGKRNGKMLVVLVANVEDRSAL